MAEVDNRKKQALAQLNQRFHRKAAGQTLQVGVKETSTCRGGSLCH
jgi:hypothetical protein